MPLLLSSIYVGDNQSVTQSLIHDFGAATSLLFDTILAPRIAVVLVASVLAYSGLVVTCALEVDVFHWAAQSRVVRCV